MIKYVVIIFVFILWYRLLFKQDSIMSKKVIKQSKKIGKAVQQIDKRDIEKRLLFSKKVIQKFKDLKLLPKDFETRIYDKCQTLGIINVDVYVSEICNREIPNAILFAIITGLTAVQYVFVTLMFTSDTGVGMAIGMFENIIMCFPIVMFCISIYAIVGIERSLKKRVEVHIGKIENDYYLLFDHFYFYYGYDSSQRRPLAKVVSKFTYNISPDMEMLLTSLLNDCKESEQIALGNMQRRYRSSLKVSELATKLIACVNNKPLAKDNLNSLKEQIKTERAILDAAEDEKTVGKFTTVMMTAMMIIMLSSIVGTLSQLA